MLAVGVGGQAGRLKIEASSNGEFPAGRSGGQHVGRHRREELLVGRVGRLGAEGGDLGGRGR